MKKTALSGLILSLIGCATPSYETRTSVSNFDGTVSKGSTPALLSCNEWKEECPVLTFISTSKSENTIGVEVEINSSLRYYNLRKLAFNIDGNIVESENLGLTEHNYKQYINARESKTVFIMPRTLINDLKSSKRILVKVTTLQDGVFERAMLDKNVESKAYQALKAFNP